MKYRKILFCILFSVFCTGCQAASESNTSLPDLDSIIQQENTSDTEQETEKFSENIYYLTSHQTEDSAKLTKFQSHIETDGFHWNECDISAIPDDAKILIYDFPKEDFTAEEFQILKDYTDRGGDMLIFLPASESEVRYKFLGNLLESFSILLDYDKVDILEQDFDLIALQIIGMPERMTAYTEFMTSEPVYMRNLRSFHMLGDYATDELFIDAMLQTSAAAVGQPFGGIEDDPLTYENEKLNVLLYSRDTLRDNASVIVCGADDFLFDENFDSPMSQGAQNWIYSSLNWFMNYNNS